MKIPFLSAESRYTNCGLLEMRIVFGIALFLKHGYEKVTEFPRMSHQFPNLFPLGEAATLTIALISDGIRSLLLVLNLLLVEQMLIRNRNRHLCLHLHKLVLHVEHNLFQHPLRILGLLHQVIQIRPQQRAYSIQ